MLGLSEDLARVPERLVCLSAVRSLLQAWIDPVCLVVAFFAGYQLQPPRETWGVQLQEMVDQAFRGRRGTAPFGYDQLRVGQQLPQFLVSGAEQEIWIARDGECLPSRLT